MVFHTQHNEGQKVKKNKMKLIGCRAVFFLTMAILFFWQNPCRGMDAMTMEELGEFTGQDGISIGFGGGMTVSLTFNSISFGDTDGWGDGTAGNNSAGWLLLVGTGTNTGTLSATIPKDAVMSIDVGTVCASTAYYPLGQSTHPGFSIPRGKSFFTFSLTNTIITLDDPETVYVCLAPSSSATGAVSATNRNRGNIVGWMKTSGLAIDLEETSQTDPSRCFIWAH